MSFAEISGHLCYVLILASFLVRKMERLRALSIAASTLSIYYSLKISDNILWPSFFWSLVFIAINSWQLFWLYQEKRNLQLTPLEEWLISGPLNTFSHQDIKALSRLTELKRFTEDTKLLSAGEMVQSLYIIREGEAIISQNGSEVARLGPGKFLGEMSFLAGGAARADVSMGPGSTLLQWNRKSLDEWQNMERKLKLQSSIGAQLVDAALNS